MFRCPLKFQRILQRPLESVPPDVPPRTLGGEGVSMASVHTEKTSTGARRYRVKWRDEDNRQRSRSFATELDARGFAVEIDRGTALDPRDGDRTLEDFAMLDYLPSRRWSGGTRELVESQLRTRILPELGGKRLGDIRRTDVARFVRNLEAKELAPATIAATYNRLAAILRAAVGDRLIHEAPLLSLAERPRTPRDRSLNLVVLSASDVEQIAAVVPGNLGALVWLVAGTGLRLGEALGVTTQALDIGARTLSVERQLITPSKGDAHLTTRLKSTAAHRNVPLGERACSALSHHMATFPPLSVDDPVDSTRDLVFTNRDRRPVRRQAAGDAWAKARKKLDLPAGARGWHSLRHYYASALIRGGLSVVDVQANLGHATAEETLGTYAHLWPDSENRTRAAIDELMPAAKPRES